MAVVERRWRWRFDLAPETVWSLLSDTNRFNEAVGTPKYAMEEIPQADGSMLRLAEARLGRFELAWEERPYEWVAGRAFSQTRLFRKGPFRRLGPALTIAREGEETIADYRLAAEPSGLIGRALIAFGFLERAGRAFDRLVARAVEAARAGEIRPNLLQRPPMLEPGALERLDGMATRLEEMAYSHGLARRLADRIATAQEVDLVRIRPLALAREWGVPGRNVAELLLAAVTIGMLDLKWDVLCPRCRGAKASTDALDGLPTQVHCPSCNVDFERDFARNVEISFTPASAVRVILAGDYCLSGPWATRHVTVQQTLAPGETRTVDADLNAGPWRLRTLERGHPIDFEHEGGPPPRLFIDAERAWLGEERAAPGTIVMTNAATSERTIVIEDRGWIADALTGHQATTLQAFRDLFAGQAPRPGDEMGIGSVAVMFTDLRGSTALYEHLGDSAAFALVREHFAWIAAKVRARGGAIVKTIGDAVMAAFAEPADAVASAIELQRDIGELNRALMERLFGYDALILKIGLNAGPAIIVRLNDRLDYFGSSVNLASRLQGVSRGGDLAITKAVAGDPRISPLVAPLAFDEVTADLKGFDRPVEVRLVRP